MEATQNHAVKKTVLRPASDAIASQSASSTNNEALPTSSRVNQLTEKSESLREANAFDLSRLSLQEPSAEQEPSADPQQQEAAAQNTFLNEKGQSITESNYFTKPNGQKVPTLVITRDPWDPTYFKQQEDTYSDAGVLESTQSTETLSKTVNNLSREVTIETSASFYDSGLTKQVIQKKQGDTFSYLGHSRETKSFEFEAHYADIPQTTDTQRAMSSVTKVELDDGKYLTINQNYDPVGILKTENTNEYLPDVENPEAKRLAIKHEKTFATNGDPIQIVSTTAQKKVITAYNIPEMKKELLLAKRVKNQFVNVGQVTQPLSEQELEASRFKSPSNNPI